MTKAELENMMAGAVRAAKVASREESPRAQYGAKVAQLPPAPPKHAIIGPQDADEAREASEALSRYLDEIHRDTSTVPFFRKLKEAGLIDGGKWCGSIRQAGVAAYIFARTFEDAGTKGKNAKQYDRYFQYLQFEKYGINPGTLKAYVSAYRDYLKDGAQGLEKYAGHEDEIAAVLAAIGRTE